MPRKYQMSKDLWSRFDGVRVDLDELHSDLRDQFDERSETWKDSEKGQVVEEWLNQLESLLDQMNEVESAPEEV